MVAKKVWFEGERIYIETDDGRTLWQSILYYQRLRNATKEQREALDAREAGLEDVQFTKVPAAWCGGGVDRHVPWAVMTARAPFSDFFSSVMCWMSELASVPRNLPMKDRLRA